MTKKTAILKGISVSSGLAFGQARVIYGWEQTVGERKLEKSQITDELLRLDNAVNESLLEINRWKKMAGEKVDGPVARIFDTQLMIASDQEFIKKVKEEIRSKHLNAEFVYNQLVEKSITPLKKSDDEYMRQMVYEIEAVSKMVLGNLRGHHDYVNSKFPADTIVIGTNFTAAEVLNLCDRGAKAIVTTEGSATSHMALIARSLLVPTIVAVPRVHLRSKNGDQVIVDADQGEVTLRPPQNVWTKLVRQKKTLTALPLTRLQKLPDFPPKTMDKVAINLAANISLPGPADRILPKHNVGVGLYRTEFLYLQNGTFPSEEEQFELYDDVAAVYYPQDVVIRTFDLGSDKYYKNDRFGEEKNPALGWRGIRAALDMPEIFKNQARAILRASHRGNVKILLPMITDTSEIRKVSNIIKRTMVELRKDHHEFDKDMEIGIMIEVPAAALNIEELADKVDFFSIGSNDLTQYTLAVDRDNLKLAKVFNPLHPAVIRLFKMTIDAAKAHNIPVSLCGELSGDPLAIPLLIGLGIDLLSMNPSRLLGACKLISRLKYENTQKLAEEVLKAKKIKDVESKLFEFNMSL